MFLDESTSSLDEGEEARLYAEVLKVCDTIVSIGMYCAIFIALAFTILTCILYTYSGHRSSLLRFHTHELHLDGDGRFSLRELKDPTR